MNSFALFGFVFGGQVPRVPRGIMPLCQRYRVRLRRACFSIPYTLAPHSSRLLRL